MGAGEPVTLFAHGLGQSPAQVRPAGGGVAGTRVFLAFRGHDGSAAAPWSYAGLAADLRLVADAVGATAAYGVSMGAGALAALVARDPGRFERLVFHLPAALDGRCGAARERLDELAALAGRGDVDAIAELLRGDLPPEVRERPEALRFVRQRAAVLAAPPVCHALRELRDDPPVPDVSALARVRAPALVIAERGDPMHPAEVAEALAGALPNATLRVFERPGAQWWARAELRRLLTGFLGRGC